MYFQQFGFPYSKVQIPFLFLTFYNKRLRYVQIDKRFPTIDCETRQSLTELKIAVQIKPIFTNYFHTTRI